MLINQGVKFIFSLSQYYLVALPFRNYFRAICTLFFVFPPIFCWFPVSCKGCMIINQGQEANLFSATFGWIANINGKTLAEQMLSEIEIVSSNNFFFFFSFNFFSLPRSLTQLSLIKVKQNWEILPSLWRHIGKKEKPILEDVQHNIHWTFLLPRSS